MTDKALSRRLFLARTASLLPVAGAVLLGCRTAAAEAPPPLSRYGSLADAADRDERVFQCAPGVATEASIEGPYYRAGAPFRSGLVDPDVAGAPLLVTGSVLSLDCKTPLAGAVLDVWQANGNGQYDNDGTLHLPRGAMRLRGKIPMSPRGGYAFSTVLPGHYLNGARYRPAHIHVKVTAPGHVPLTTQLYFPGDPYNDGDPFIHRSLIMDMGKLGDQLEAHYDFTLRPLPGA